MGILDGIVEWIAEQVMAGLDLITTSVLGALGCDMAVFSALLSRSRNDCTAFLSHWASVSFSSTGCGSCSRTLAWEPVLKRKTRSN